MHRVLKDLQSWKEAPLDCMVLSLYQLQAYYYNEIMRGLSGLGQYSVSLAHNSIQMQEFHYLSTSPPDEIVKRIRDGNATGEVVGDGNVAGNVASNSKETSEKEGGHNLSSLARAQAIVEADKIGFNTKLHCFNVKGSSGITRVVTIFPKETCSCPSSGDCYHILAAKISIGIAISGNQRTKRNLTQLRKNTRSRKEKKSGRKKPRPNDILVEG